MKALVAGVRLAACVAVIVTVPAATPVTRPVEPLTVAMLGAELV